MIFKSTGILKYHKGNNFKLIVEVDPEIYNFYRSLIPKYQTVNPQRHAPHISVIRHEIPPNLALWGKYESESIDFLYSNVIQRGTVYWWLNVFCEQLENIRLELGLPISSSYSLPPDLPEGIQKCFHLTLGNSKKL